MGNNTTTIQISRITLEKLKILKKEHNATNYDEIIEYLMKKEQNVPETLFGIMKGETTSYLHDKDDHDHD